MEYFERKTATMATALSVPSRSLARKISRRWLLDKPISVEPATFRLEPVVCDDSLVPAHKYFLYFGRIEMGKGVLLLAEAIRRIEPELNGIRVLFVGADTKHGRNQDESVKETVLRRLGPAAAAVSFLGEQRRERLYPLIQNAEFVVLPSLGDSFPNLCLEAMALGKTVIAPSGTGFAEQFRDMESGVLFKRMSHRDLARKILFCMDNPERVQKMGVAARKKAADFEAGKMTVQMLRKYHDAIGMDRPLSTFVRPESPSQIRWLGSSQELRPRRRTLDPDAVLRQPTFQKDLTPEISVIVPSFNEEERIQGCLICLVLQAATASYEIIVVDSSADRTARIILERFPAVVLVSSERRLSCGEAKNVGLSVARGKKILFTDADIRVPSEWLQTMADHLEDFGIVGGPFLNGTPRSLTGTLGYYLEFFRVLPQRVRAGTVQYLTGGNSGYRREVIEEKAFISGIGEDIAFSYELIRGGTKAMYDPTLGVVHLNKVGFGKVFRYHMALGAGGYRYRRTLRFESPIMKMPLLSFAVPFAIVPFITLKLFLGKDFRGAAFMLLFSPLATLLYVFWAIGFYGEARKVAAS